jgi:SAM-dependent MidA family methyltransferase
VRPYSLSLWERAGVRAKINQMSAEAEIRRRIREAGPITFAEFMELALFWPQGGYYLQQEPIGPSGDYYTSPLAHPAFGALLAVQLFQMWQLMGRPEPFTVVEMGAGNGLLCRDIVAYVNQVGAQHAVPLLSEFHKSLRYVCIDRRVSSGAERHLPQDGQGPLVDRLAASGLPLRKAWGCFLSNEFLDAFPVHQVMMRQGRLREVYITQEDEHLAETLGEPSTPALAARLETLGIKLAEGQIAEINLGLDNWAEEVAAALEAGFVLTIDYGHPAHELYSTERRPRGALTTYYRHVHTDAPLQRIGRQDLTAQVDFTSVINAGRKAGLNPLGFILQRQLLDNLGLSGFQQRLTSLGLSPREIQANRAGMLDLARPDGLGNFKALAQGKNVGQPRLWGFNPAPETAALVEQLPVPLLTRQHLSLLEGRYPQMEYGFEVDIDPHF